MPPLPALLTARSRAALPLVLAAALALACSRFPLGGGPPIPGPATVAAGLTQTTVAGEGQADPGTPTAGPTTSAPTEAASATVPATATATQAATEAPSEAPDGATPPPPTAATGRPRLAPGQPINLVFINMLDGNRGWGVGHPANDESQYLLGTDDGGETWVDVSPPIAGGTPWAATTAFQGDSHAWVVLADPAAPPLGPGAPLVVWHTPDGGQTWSASQPLDLTGAEYAAPSDLVFADTLNGWLLAHVGAGMNHDYVMLFRTTDGGQTWQRLADPLATAPDSLPMSCTKTGLGFLSAEAGWVTGDCHGVAPGVFFHRASAAGQAWQPQPLPPPTGAEDLFSNPTVSCGTYSLITLPPQFVSVAVLCQNLVSGEPSRWLYRSADAGQSWEADPLPGRDLFFLDPDRVWSVDDGDPNDPTALRTLYFSDDGGISWANITTVRWGAQFDFVTPDLGWAVARSGEDMALVRTRNGGASWGLIEAEIGS